MKKLPLLITLGFVLAAAGSFFLYEYLLKRKPLSPWDLVPESSVFVYETNDCPSCVDQLQKTSLWHILRKAAFYEKPADSLTAVFDFLSAHKSGKLISTHTTRRDDFDFVFYIPTGKKTIDLPDAWTKLKSTEREFNGVKIHEITMQKQVFSWSQIDQVWVGSFAPLLLEDVIRTYSTGKESSFKTKIAAAFQMPAVKTDAGNLYVNIKRFGQLLNAFTSEPPDFVRHLGQSSMLDIKSSENNIVLNGLSLDSANQRFLLSVFTNQAPVPFNLKNYVSDRSVLFMSYGISDGKSFAKSLMKYASSRNSHFKDSLQYMNTISGVNLEKLYSSINKEIGISYLESKGENLSKVLLIESSAPEEWISALNAVSQKTSIDTIFFERFADYEIREVPVHAFPEKIFGALVPGFPSCYYTRTGNTIIMGENLDDLKSFLDDIDKEDTWGKSVAQNKFLETTLLEANMSIYFNTPLIWNTLSKSLHPKWRKFVEENQSALDALNMGAIQLSHLNNSYYTNISWSFGDYAETTEKSAPTRNTSNNNKYLTNFSRSIHKFFVVRNHSTKRDDVFVQDSSFAVSLVSDDGKVLWTVPIEKPIVGDVQQIDYFNNGKLQLLFATAGKIHLIDRLGNYVTSFPITTRENDPDFLSVVDYDHSKKYRFLLSGKSGKLWMYDKGGENLEGWAPKNVGGKLFTAAQHHRIRGKDYILAMREDGNVLLMNRRGETLKHFPLDLDARLSGNYFLESGSSLATTYFVVVSRDGYRIKFNLEGKVQSRETLIKTSPESTFRMITDENSGMYVILRHDASHFTILNENLEEIIASDFGNNTSNARLYNFGSGKIYVVLTDRNQDLSFVYDLKGNLLTPVPLESSALVVRPSRSERPKAYYANGKTLTIQPL